MSLRRLGSRADVLSATSGHPYARFVTSAATTVAGVAEDRAAIWVNDTPFGLLGFGVGPFDRIAVLLADAGELVADVGWINLPRHTAGEEPAGYTHKEHWDFRWSVTAPPPQPGEEQIIELGEAAADEINALLNLAMPDTLVRPGSDLARMFYGIHDAGTLVACGADRTSRVDHGPGATVGVVGAIAVHPEHRRRGLGAAITAGVTRRLADRHSLVVLGQSAANDTATRLYPRLGYTGVLELTSVWRASPAPDQAVRVVRTAQITGD